jgi:hypothetical protein
MEQLPDQIKAHRENIRSADNSFELTEALASVLVDIVGQTAAVSTGLATTTAVLRDTGTNLADHVEAQATALSNGLTALSTTLHNDNAAVRDHVAIQVTRLTMGLATLATTLHNDHADLRRVLDENGNRIAQCIEGQSKHTAELVAAVRQIERCIAEPSKSTPVPPRTRGS